MKADLEVGRQNARAAEERAVQKVCDAEDERDRRIGEIEEQLRNAESLRRKLHNQIQELKGTCIVKIGICGLGSWTETDQAISGCLLEYDPRWVCSFLIHLWRD